MSTPSQPADFDPYRVWLGIPKAEQPPNHYRLLGIVQFEEDPQVILEGADRQIAHLKNKQTGQRVALSQRLLQEVAAAAGCLLDPDAKEAYDSELKAKLAPVLPVPVAKPASVEPSVPVAKVRVAAVPPPPPAVRAVTPPPPPPLHQTPSQSYLARVSPGYAQTDLPQVDGPAFPAPVGASPIHAKPSGLARKRSSSNDAAKYIAGAGVGLVLLIVLLVVLNRPESSTSLAERPIPTRPAVKPKPVVKPAPSGQANAGSVAPKAKTVETPATAPVVKPTTPDVTSAQPVDPVRTPMPPPFSLLETPVGTPPFSPLPVTTIPEPANPNPNPNPNRQAPEPKKPVEPAPQRTLWRYAGGFVEQDGNVWKEMHPSGDYYVLAPANGFNPTAGPTSEYLEFSRPSGGRLRVYDDRLEVAEQVNFVEFAKGTWGTPAEQLQLESQPEAMLQRACHLYAEALAKARKKLLVQFDQEMSGTKRIGKAEEQLAVMTVLTAEKKRFEETGLVPWSAPMRASTARYLSEVMDARGPSLALFEKAAQHYVSRKDQETASSIIALRNKALAPVVIAKLSLTDVRPPRSPSSFTFPRRTDDELPADDDDFPLDPRTGAVRLWSNGALNYVSGKSNWALTSSNLVLTLIRPTHTVRETIAMNDRGDDITGKAVFSNNYALNFTGRVLGDLADYERRPEVKFAPPKNDLQ